MSDGKFNRTLLPRTDFQSGVRVGKAAARSQAEEAFKLTLQEVFPSATAEQKENARKLFLQRIHEEQ
jgi:hypothetical protein